MMTKKVMHMFEWITGNAHTLVVTLYPTNLTLNNSAAAYFADVRYATVGIDRQNGRIAIRPVTKREIDLKIIPLEHLHKVSIGKGYARISNKMVCDEIAEILSKPLNGQKVISQFDEKDRMLIVDLAQPLS